jgi:putative ABC transport system permease protein
MALIAIGIALGLIGALAMGRALVSLLLGVSAFDLTAVGTAIISLSVVAVVACCVPARRATKVNPIEALRTE